MSETLFPADFELHQHHAMGEETQRREHSEANTDWAVKYSHGMSIDPFRGNSTIACHFLTKATLAASTDVLRYRVMEFWSVLSVNDLQPSRGSSVCITCQHFRYSCDQQGRTLLGCDRQHRQLPQGTHLTHHCLQWAPRWHRQAGWAPEVA